MRKVSDGLYLVIRAKELANDHRSLGHLRVHSRPGKNQYFSGVDKTYSFGHLKAEIVGELNAAPTVHLAHFLHS